MFMSNQGLQPKNWRKVKLGKAIKEVRDLYEPKQSEHFKYIGLEHIEQNSLKLSGIGDSSLTQSTKKIFKSGDILFGSLRVYFRKVIKPKFSGVCSTDITVLRAKKSYDQRFLFYFIANQNFINFASAPAEGTKMPRVSWKYLARSEWFFPFFREQKKIALILSTYDDLIEMNNKKIKNLEEMAHAIYNEWFVKFKFPCYKKAKFKNGIPEGWKRKSILKADYFNFCKSKVKKFEGNKEYFATANINGIDIIKEGEMVIYENKPSRAQIQPKINTVWFARMKNSHKVLVYREIIKDLANKHILSSGMLGFEAKDDYFGFLYFTINSDWFHKLKDQYATGATQISLTNSGLSKMKIILPEKIIIKRYSKIINPFIDKILILQRINKNLRKTRDLLLPKLMSGEIKI